MFNMYIISNKDIEVLEILGSDPMENQIFDYSLFN
jgi:hypothetical protein